jgi:hypothetical protein
MTMRWIIRGAGAALREAVAPSTLAELAALSLFLAGLAVLAALGSGA